MSSEAPNQAGSMKTTGANEKSVTFAPINRIPFDIFQVIITMCQENPSSTFRFTVSHVCHLWRDYVLAMPLLWNSLYIEKPVPCWEMLEALLKRSGQAPLDIYIGQAPFVKSALPHLRKIMRMIVPHLGRWRTLHLSDAPYKVRRILLDQIRAKTAPYLEEVKVSQTFIYSRPSRLKLENSSPKWRAENVFEGFPNLNSVEWTNSTSDLTALPRFRNLKNLIIGAGTLNDIPPRPFIQLIHRILLDSPSLENLTIYNGFENSNTGAMSLQLPPLTHRSLQTLFIESSHTIRSAVIRSLLLPKLRTFSTGYDVDPIDLSCCDIIAQENSLPELRVVYIREGVVISPNLHPHMPFLRPAIQNLVNLRVLTFYSIDFGEGRWLPDLGNCCPHLRWLYFVYCVGFTILPIRLLVETRIQRDGIHPLEILCIETHFSAPPDSEYIATKEDVVWFSKFLRFKSKDYGSEIESEVYN